VLHAGQQRVRGLNNAYMLVYIRVSEWDSVMRETGKEEMEERVRAILEQQLAEKMERRRKKMQAHRFVRFKAVTFEQMQAHVRAAPARPSFLYMYFAGAALQPRMCSVRQEAELRNCTSTRTVA
jgi:hypothetical protein